MFKSNSLIAFFTVSALFLLFSCNSESSENSSSSNVEVKTDSLVRGGNLNALVSASKMNVVYIGVDNPISIAIPGVAQENVRAIISNGAIRKSEDGSYIVNVNSGNSTIITVSVEENGKTIPAGTHEFRIKTVPDPTPYFAGMGVGDDKVMKSQLTAAQGVVAKMSNFDFDVKFKVTSFKMTMIVGGTPIEKVSRNNRVTSDMKTMLKNAKPGSKVYIERIKAIGPDGTERYLGTLAFKVI